MLHSTIIIVYPFERLPVLKTGAFVYSATPHAIGFYQMHPAVWKYNCAGGGTRTHTGYARRISRPARLPFRHSL